MLPSLIKVFKTISALSVLFIMSITCLDIILRRFNSSLYGAHDLVCIGIGIAVAAALPITTAVKGHVAIEYFFHRLSSKGRIIVDSIMRTLQTLLFLAISVAFFKYGHSLYISGEVSPTLECPTYFLEWIIALSALLTAAISAFHLFHPQKELI